MSSNFLYNAYINYLKIYNESKKTNLDNIENYHIIGIYDSNLNIWYNGWSLYVNPIHSNLYKKSKELLIYGLDIEKTMLGISHDIKYIIKHILVTSKIIIAERITQLNLILAVITYLTKAKQIFKTVSNNCHTYYIKI